MADSSSHRLLLRVWRDVPFPGWMRQIFLRALNPSVMVGAMALIQDEQGRVLLVEHTYRRQVPWGLPGGWLKRAESPEAGLMREVFEETGLEVRVEQLLAADFWSAASSTCCTAAACSVARIDRLTRRASTAGPRRASCRGYCPINGPCYAKPGC